MDATTVIEQVRSLTIDALVVAPAAEAGIEAGEVKEEDQGSSGARAIDIAKEASLR